MNSIKSKKSAQKKLSKKASFLIKQSHARMNSCNFIDFKPKLLRKNKSKFIEGYFIHSYIY